MHTRKRSSSSVKSLPRLLPYLRASMVHGLSVLETLALSAVAIPTSSPSLSTVAPSHAPLID
eukprot:scaffold18425_cov51-Phaeocystis_antarctica.AAC.6